MSSRAANKTAGKKTSGGKSKSKTKTAKATQLSARRRNRSTKAGAFDTYIKAVNADVNKEPKIGLSSSEATAQLNRFVMEFTAGVAPHVAAALRARGRNTLSDDDVLVGVATYLPKSLADAAIKKANAAVNEFKRSRESGGKNKSKASRASQAGLKIGIGRVAKAFYPHVGGSKASGSKDSKLRHGRYSMVFLAGVIEYLLTIILKDAAKTLKDSRRLRLRARNILLAIREHPTLNRLTSGWVIQGGVVPGIDERVSERPKGKRRTSA